jgi:ubiquinone/menaquinone biosynthesis C-methylase UbiE
LRFPDQSFECAALNLILSVAGNPKQVLAETVRVLKPKGKILIWDKFARPGKIHWVRKVLNGITSGLGTDITRNLEALLQGIPVNVLENQDSLFKGNYRAVLLEKRCE